MGMVLPQLTTKYHITSLDLSLNVEGYIQTRIFRKIMERISFKRRCRFGKECVEEKVEKVLKRLEIIEIKEK